MRRRGLISGTALAGLMLGTAGVQAADMPVYYEPEPVFGGWYLRGDVGASHQRVDEIYNTAWDAIADPIEVREKDFEASWFVGLGVGYQFNEWFRADVTGEYRGGSDFYGLDRIDDVDPDTINEYRSEKSEWTFLANVYWDIGTWHSITPFVGAGIGASYNKIGDLTDTNLNDIQGGAFCAVNGCADENGEWDLAWALHAGFAYAVSPNLTFEVAYRYLHLGDAQSGDIVPNAGGGTYNTLKFDDLTSHDIKFGVRYLFY